MLFGFGFILGIVVHANGRIINEYIFRVCFRLAPNTTWRVMKFFGATW